MATQEQGRAKRRRFSCDHGQTSQTVVQLSEVPSHSRHTVAGAEATQSQDSGDAAKYSQSQWSLLRPVGGRFTDLDPVFSADEKFMFLGLEKGVHVFSTSTSRLFQTLQIKNSGKIIGYRLSPNSQHLYIFTSSGSVSKWDWISGTQVFLWETSCKTISTELCSIDIEMALHCASYSLRQRKDGQRELLITLLEEDLTGGNSRKIVALETNRPISVTKVACKGRAVIVSDGQHLFVGSARVPDIASFKSFHYIWREVALPVNVTCLDVRESIPAENSTSLGSDMGTALSTVDLVMGGPCGSILVYHDILNSLLGSEDPCKSEDSGAPVFRKLHWHRGPVSTVRWSRDGNYLISGGSESVMVLWQLDTGRKHFLPHLSSPICNIVVSPTGNSYAVKLADNTVIVLSATELQPCATIVGLQLPSSKVAQIGDMTPESIPGSVQVSDTTPATLHPQNPDHLLIAVPACQTMRSEGEKVANLSILQTVDIRTGAQLSRQALARTNVTVLNTGPEGTEILSPDIKYLEISQDGKWLATVDDWRAHLQDARALRPCHITKEQSIGDRREIFLKFWMWNDSIKLWELVTRIDGPHFQSPGGAVSVLGLASRPHTHEFATVGDDGILRLWDPAPRHHSGLKSRTDTAQPQETWRCRRSVNLKSERWDNVSLSTACMSFSEDGSVLAVCLQSQSSSGSGLIHLIDADMCEICHSREGLFSGNPRAVRFLGRHVIIASGQSVSIWDTVDDVFKNAVSQDSRPVNLSTQGRPVLLAVNCKAQSFAVITRRFFAGDADRSTKRRHKTHFHVEVYTLQSSKPVFQSALRCHPLSLLSDPRSSDYIIVDAAAYVRRLGCPNTNPGPAGPSSELSSHLKTGLEGLFGRRALRNASVPKLPSAEGPTMQSKDLAGIFSDAPPFSLPPVSVLFRDVIDSFATS